MCTAIWVDAQEVRYGVLVHEFVHVLMPDLPREIAEIIPQYVVEKMW